MTWNNDQVSEFETNKILTIARRQLAIDGDFVEMGCYKGDTSLLLAEVIKDGSVDNSGTCGKHVENSESDVRKRLWIYDSFEGLPEKRKEDMSPLGENFQGGELGVTKREVKERFLRAGLKVPIIKKAWFNELSESDIPKEIGFAFLDGDFYESIRDSLELVTPRMVKSGTIIVHDYANPALPGVAKAVDEWLRKNHASVGGTSVYQSMIVIGFIV